MFVHSSIKPSAKTTKQFNASFKSLPCGMVQSCESVSIHSMDICFPVKQYAQNAQAAMNCGNMDCTPMLQIHGVDVGTHVNELSYDSFMSAFGGEEKWYRPFSRR
jgi:hypothetical protein